MASTWSSLKIELLETGQNPGQWGNLTNVNLGDAVLGEAITGQATVDFASDADVTITLTDSATTQAARNLRLNITESSTGVGSVRSLILGSGCQIEKFYLINNTGTGAKTVKNTSGTGITVPAGKATLVFNNGTNVVDAASYFSSLTLGSALPVASGGTNLTSFTSGGVVYASSSSALATGSALTFDGTNLAVGTTTIANSLTDVLTVGKNSGTYDASIVVRQFGAATAAGLQLIAADNTGASYNSVTSTTSGGTQHWKLGGVGGSFGTLPFSVSGSEGMRLTSTGLGIGTTTINSKLAVAGVSNSYGLFVSGGGTSGQSYGASIQAGTTSADMSFRVIDYSGANTYLAVLGNGNVGVGTASPRASSKLDVFGETIALGDNATYYGTIGYSAGAGLMSLAAESGGGIRFLSGATERMRLDSAGNLSLNTTTPAYFAGTSNLLNISINRLPSTGAIFNASQSAAFMNIDGASGGSSFQFCTASAANTQPSERMRLTGAGSLIVGDTATSVTAEKVSIRNNSGPALILRSTTNPGMRFYTAADDGSTSCQINYYSGTAFSIETISTTPIAFLTNNTERARITSGGDVYVGTTTGTIGTANFGVVLYGNGTLVGSRNVDSSAACLYYGGNAGYFQILGNGNAQNTNNSYGALSDVKLKENIVDASPKLADLMQVKVRNYNLIGDTTKQLGVVAQELETVFPAMVSETTDKDAEGNDLGTATKAVKYSVFVPMLIKAMQEQQAIIESLKARLDAANL